ncbi:hypothetical protein [Microbacterium testaceum]|uniref:hypothetical protein n=1 Tax=Microbacterium testaceum TaxID=2033 RepID=UPI0012455565|nr:hypothetical protein [Microbacterium testaceum]
MPAYLSEPAEAALWAIANLDPSQLHPELIVLRSASIVENYVDKLLGMLTAEYLEGESAFQTALRQITRERLSQSWNGRREWLRDSFEIAVQSETEEQNFLLLTQLRNTLAHGPESLTGLQRAKLTEQLNLEREFRNKLAVIVDGPKVRVSVTTASRAISVSNGYVRALDEVARPVLMARRLF